MIQADSGNERYKTCTGAIREAPRRKKKMKKKTIAILLILVIGVVGVFAAPPYTQSKTVYLETEIQAINEMIVTADGELDWDDYSTTTSAYGTTETAYGALSDSSNYNKDGTIAYLHARSNNRGGFAVTMTATPLKSTVDGVGTEYIDFIVKCGEAIVETTNDAVAVTAGTVKTLTYGGSQMPILEEEITVNLKEKLAEAAEGTYTGSIIFSYTAS